ncbi:hypothetical protein F4677DRAFT_403267 [Hypoxylon crocopeplum]|nr:hypothetical protein F4677DRAFT_403267 [Hypoxylon crocopeplum]
MAPTNKSSASTSKGTPNGNPAPDFTVHMNRIQMQLEAGLKVARAFNPRSDPNGTSSPAGKSFSALSGNAHASGSQPQSRGAGLPLAATRRELEAADFSEEWGLDANAGIGSLKPPSSSAAAAAGGNRDGNDRDTARLRGRLLGKRGRGTDSKGTHKWTRKEESSDDEAGRSGLGRAKNGKRPRAEMEAGDGEQAKGDSERVEAGASPKSKMSPVENTGELVNHNKDIEGSAEASTTLKPTGGDESSQANAEGSNKRRKKKKKKKPKDKAGGN